MYISDQLQGRGHIVSTALQAAQLVWTETAFHSQRNDTRSKLR